MKKTILLFIVIISIALLFSAFSGNVSAIKKASNDCCQTFVIQDIYGNPIYGCTIHIWDVESGFSGYCTTSSDRKCEICDLDPSIGYRYEVIGCGGCAFAGSKVFYCGQENPIVYTCGY